MSMNFVRMANQTASTIRETTHGRTASGMVAANNPIVKDADIPLFFQYENVIAFKLSVLSTPIFFKV